jgi:hypothetical protein
MLTTLSLVKVTVTWEPQMNYLFLAYQDEERWANLSESERALIEEACLIDEQSLRQSGHLFALENLQDNDTAITVQIVDGKISLTESISAETKGRLLQLFFINARDLNEAIHLISKMPQTRKGPVEVRSILKPNWQQFEI